MKDDKQDKGDKIRPYKVGTSAKAYHNEAKMFFGRKMLVVATRWRW